MNAIMFSDENENEIENEPPGRWRGDCNQPSVIEAKRQKPQFGCWLAPTIKQSK